MFKVTSMLLPIKAFFYWRLMYAFLSLEIIYLCTAIKLDTLLMQSSVYYGMSFKGQHAKHEILCGNVQN